MGVYQYAITKTKRIKGISETLGDIGIVEFRYKHLWSPNEALEKKFARLDANIDRKWAGKELPVLVTNPYGKGLYVWVGETANSCEMENLVSIGSSHGFDVLLKWANAHGVVIPSWLEFAGECEHRNEIPYVPNTYREFRELHDACSTKRLRERGDVNAQPLIPNNRYWVNDELSVY